MRRILLLFFALPLLLLATDTQADDLDDFIRQQLRKRQVPGLSLAIIQNGKIVKAQGYGVTQRGGSVPVTPSTLFQAGSISKSVAAVGALQLVEKGKLALDEDVNARLRTWKVPENEFTKDKKVTLRGLLSHTTGLTVHGFPGYEVGSPVPTVVQILNGEKPTNTAPVRVDFVPGTRWRYSGGGYTVMQLLMDDVTGQSFPPFMRQTVLKPLGMNESTYEQPLPAEKAAKTATGHYRDRGLVKGRWHVYPEMAAAGLWTTPSDLARFAIGIQNAYAGKPGTVLSQAMTRQMLTDQKDHDGLGVFLQGEGKALRFSHNGRDEGFDAAMVAGAESGLGVVVMINANDNSQLVGRILDFIAKRYNWPGDERTVATKPTPASVPASALVAYEGRYELENNYMIAFGSENGRLVTLVDGFPDEEFIPETPTRFVSADRDVQVEFSPGEHGTVSNLVWKAQGKERIIPRIGPLFHTLKATADADPARTRRVEAALKALSLGGKAVEEAAVLTPGARRDFAQGAPPTAGLKSLSFIAAEDVRGRGIERHDSPVGWVLFYQMTTDAAPRNVLVHVTPDGLVTDYDVVED